MKIEVNWNLCDGNGMCAVEAPDFFDISDEDELILLNDEVPENELAQVNQAVRACPKNALRILDV